MLDRPDLVVVVGPGPLGMAPKAAPARAALQVGIELHIAPGQQVPVLAMSLLLVRNTGIVRAGSLALDALSVRRPIRLDERMAMATEFGHMPPASISRNLVTLHFFFALAPFYQRLSRCPAANLADFIERTANWAIYSDNRGAVRNWMALGFA